MPHILIVEDEPAIAESLAYALRRDGFGVTLAATLAGAERSLDVASLVLLDLMLPDGSGFDLIGKVRRSGIGTPIIVLTSRDDEADRVAALETGADDYVTKPFSTREIVARVRAVLRRAAPPAPLAASTTSAPPPAAAPAPAPASAPMPLSVDDATRRAYVHGREVELTRVEFDLLACLLAAPGRVFTRAQLIDRVWGDGFAISDRTIDSHVKGLRRKVESAGGNPAFVETVRGVGYRVTDRPAAPPQGGAPDAP
ncbi:response regulator transcription factor [Polyangium spumosum]|uniref:Response regulator n=1 Tax=Polyangium spumosum TaxID=889282 RepID=A0A6N7PTS4_9BACT|nr:response regulator transcription factor [Polyangium spumosum]MRG95458.1 response regulator [Polyangium spumosum]